VKIRVFFGLINVDQSNQQSEKFRNWFNKFKIVTCNWMQYWSTKN